MGNTKRSPIHNPTITLITVDASSVSKPRANVGSFQEVSFHASWAHNGSSVKGATLFVNGSSYETDSNGWTKFKVTSSKVGKTSWRITGAKAGNISRYEQAAPNPSIVWDRIKVLEVNVSDERADVGSVQFVFVKAILEYEGEKLGADDQLFINGTKAVYDEELDAFKIAHKLDKVAKLSFKVSGANHTAFRITALYDPIGAKSIIWDRVSITLSVKDDRVSVGSDAPIKAFAVYEFDGSKFDGLYELNDTLRKHEVGKFGYRVKSIVDPTYGLTAFISNEVSIIFDEVKITLEAVDQTISVGSKAEILVKGYYRFDNSSWSGTVVLNDTLTKNLVGRYTYKAKAMTDSKYGITAFTSNTVSIIFDRVLITLSVEDKRVDVGEKASISATGIFEFDSTSWEGELMLNDTLEKHKVGKYGYTVASITDSKYGITAFRSNTVAVIFDRVIVEASGTTDGRIDVGTYATVFFVLKYEFDGSLVKDGFVYINGVEARFSPKDSRWELRIKRDEVTKEAFKVTKVAGNAYGITVLEHSAKAQELIWDKVHIKLVKNLERVEVGKKPPIYWVGWYEYDKKNFIGNVVLNEGTSLSIGRRTYVVKEIFDPMYGLKKFTSNSVDITFDRIVLDVKDAWLFGRIELMAKLSYESDGAPIADAKVLFDEVEAKNLGNGTYLSKLYSLMPYITYEVQVEKAGFPPFEPLKPL